MRLLLILFLSLGLAAPAAAEVIRRESPHGVEATVERLEAAVAGAGARLFAKVPHSKGAEAVGVEMPPMTLMIFGNPKIGTPAITASPEAGLVLPLRVLVYEDEAGQTWLAWEEPGEMLTARGVPADAPVIGRIAGALDKLTAKAASE